ncbi:hypothetical protein H8K52_10690 [Undibacterium seohonense]|uniref:Uncharacterized protein n=1 Tax=Undibacterium seohonense TaxID=1344950 RepID=A0ABR6X4N4_9BURK|nr:hypothetical protein [Undibacterium seohonense]MBC3807810.1 hypothetical protein [Undibacterium seohonense]
MPLKHTKKLGVQRNGCVLISASVKHKMVIPTSFEWFLRQQGGRLLLVNALISLIPLFIYEGELDASFILALKYLSAPIFILSVYIYLFKMPSYRSETSRIMGIFVTLAVAALLTVMSGSYLLIINAFGPSQSELAVQGNVTKKEISGRNSTRYKVTLTDINGRQITLDVSFKEYDQLVVGQMYSQRLKVGSLGLLYR